MMTRFLLAVAILNCALSTIGLTADVPENSPSAEPAPANAAPIYVKVISPVDPATPVIEEDQPVIESWIMKSIENGRQANLRAVTAWAPLVENCDDATKLLDDAMELWDGNFSGVRHGCPIRAHIIERKDGWIKIKIRVWGAFPIDITATLKDEPGSREVVPVTQAKTEHGMPHVAIFIGPQVK